MADMETALRALVLQNAAIVAVFGQRYYIDRIPDNVTYPLMRAQTVNDAEQDTHENIWGTKAMIQLDIWDDDKAGCNTSAALVRNWLHRYHGGFATGNAIIKVRNAPSVPDPETKMFRRILEVSILYI